jgi:hypothetical protein
LTGGFSKRSCQGARIRIHWCPLENGPGDHYGYGRVLPEARH